MEFRDCVQAAGVPLSIFVFSSVKAISQYRVEEILEMGITGFWIGYEGTRSNYAKQQGRPVAEIFREFREHGITILTSMIVGFDYQTPEIVARELEGLMALKPALAQFLIYGPTPGTPFYERIMKEGLLHDRLKADQLRYWKSCDGFTAMVKHPTLRPEQVEALQRRCFAEDFNRLGPSIFRVVETAWLGYLKHRGSDHPYLRRLSDRFRRDVRVAYPVFLAGRLFGPSRAVRRSIAELERWIKAELGAPTFGERLLSLAAVGAAVWTWITLRVDALQHPALTRHAYRVPEGEKGLSHLWNRLHADSTETGVAVRVELQHARHQVWIRLEGMLTAAHAEGLGANLRESLAATRGRLVLDLKHLQWKEAEALRALASRLDGYRSRIRLILPRVQPLHPELLLLAQLFKTYTGRS